MVKPYPDTHVSLFHIKKNKKTNNEWTNYLKSLREKMNMKLFLKWLSNMGMI